MSFAQGEAFFFYIKKVLRHASMEKTEAEKRGNKEEKRRRDVNMWLLGSPPSTGHR